MKFLRIHFVAGPQIVSLSQRGEHVFRLKGGFYMDKLGFFLFFFPPPPRRTTLKASTGWSFSEVPPAIVSCGLGHCSRCGFGRFCREAQGSLVVPKTSHVRGNAPVCSRSLPREGEESKKSSNGVWWVRMIWQPQKLGRTSHGGEKGTCAENLDVVTTDGHRDCCFGEKRYKKRIGFGCPCVKSDREPPWGLKKKYQKRARALGDQGGGGGRRRLFAGPI